ncbi:MAG: 4Fe-4S cluster-binding domain-containing protein, partial [Candidatus Hodarchaeota archaeon]
VILAKKKYSYFSLNYPKIITFSNSAIEEYISRLKNEVGQLVLNISERCNMRCEYCAYSGSYYYNRKHSSKMMNFNTAKKVLDFYYKTNKKEKKMVIGFYGGEPLLNFQLIKRIINYIENYYNEKNIN